MRRPPGEGETILRIEDLVVHIVTREGTVRAVNGVDLTLRRGETLGIVGESGCGKSLTGRAVLGILPKAGRFVRGRVLLTRPDRPEPVDLLALPVDGAEIRKVRGRVIAMVFQEPMTSLSPVHTIGNQFAEAVRLHLRLSKRAARERAIAALDRVGIPDPARRVDSYPFELSGGMRQRAMIAMALACEPDILVADEPTTALDVTIQAQILELLMDLRDSFGLSIMLITHNLGVVAQVCDRVAVMYLGRIVEEAPVRRLVEAPLHPYTGGLLRSVPILGRRKRQALVPIEGTVPGPEDAVYGCAFHPRCPEAMPGRCEVHPPALVDRAEGRRIRCFLHADAVEEAG